MGISIAGHVRGGHSHATAYLGNCLIYEIHPQFLVAKVGSFLEHQMFLQENDVVDYQDDLTDGFVFSLNPKIVFPVAVFRENPYIPYSYGDICLHDEIPLRENRPAALYGWWVS